MGTFYGFLTGVAIGAGVTVVGALVLSSRSGVGLADAVSPGGTIQQVAHMEDRLRALKTQRDALEAKLAIRDQDVARLQAQLAGGGPPQALPAGTTPDTPQASEEIEDPAIPDSPPVVHTLDADLKRAGAVLRDREAAPEARAAEFESLLAALEGSDADRALIAARWLRAVGDGLSPDQVQRVRVAFARRVDGDPLRPDLAAAVALGLHDSPDLARFLSVLPRPGEPEVRRIVLRSLGRRHPVPAFRDYALRLVQEETDTEVLGSLLDEDYLLGAITDTNASQFVAALERRLSSPMFAGAMLRGRAYLCVGLAAVHAGDAARAALERLAPLEANSAAKAFADSLRTALQSDELTLPGLAQLWKEHRGKLRDE